MRRQLLYLFVVAACGVVLNSNLAFAETESLLLERIRLACLNQVRLIRAIEFTMQFETQMSLTQNEIHQLSSDVKLESGEIAQQGLVDYTESGDKYRIESVFTDGVSGRTDTEISAFNGDRYQVLYKEKKGLTTKTTPYSANPSRTFNPLTMMFVWLLDGSSSQVFTEIKNESHWNKAFATARYIGQLTEKGMAVEVVEFPFPTTEMLPEGLDDSTIRVHFAPSLDYYPVALVAMRPNGEPFGEVRLKAWEELDVDGQKAIVPLNIWLTMQMPGDGKTTATLTIQPETIQINHSIDEEYFTIPATWATVVEDGDQTDLENEKLERERLERLAQAKAWRERIRTDDIPTRDSRLSGIIFTCALIVFLSLLVYKRRMS